MASLWCRSDAGKIELFLQWSASVEGSVVQVHVLRGGTNENISAEMNIVRETSYQLDSADKKSRIGVLDVE